MAQPTIYLQRDGVNHFAVKHKKDGKLGIAGPGLAEEINGLLNEREEGKE